MAISLVPQSASVTITQPKKKLPHVVGAGMRFMDTNLHAVCNCQITGLPTDKPRGWTLGTIQLLWATTNWAYYRGQNNDDGDSFLQYARPPARPEQECRDTYSFGNIFVETRPKYDIRQFVAQNYYRLPLTMTAIFDDQPVITHPLTRSNSLTSKTNFLREVQIEWQFCTVFSLRNPEPLRGSDSVFSPSNFLQGTISVFSPEGGVVGTYTHLKHFFWNQHWHVQCEPTDFANLTQKWTITEIGGTNGNGAHVSHVFDGGPTDPKLINIITAGGTPNCMAVGTRALQGPDIQESAAWRNYDVRR
jgi:hypothetical protein